jgi:hypothetical protein
MAFPNTAVLDTFNGANETPIAGSWGGSMQSSGRQIKVVSNQAENDGSGGNGVRTAERRNLRRRRRGLRHQQPLARSA